MAQRRIVCAHMSKSKWFAIILSVPIIGISCIAYAQTTYYDLPSLTITNPGQPASSIAPSGALHVPFTRMNLTAHGGDIVVSEITVQRVGPTDDEAFDDIVLLDGDGEELGSDSLDDDHIVRFSDPIHIPRNTTVQLTVAANMAEDLTEFDGQMSYFMITDIKASGYLPVQL